MLGVLGVLAGLALLIYLALRGANILIIALLCSGVVALSNGLHLSQALMDTYMTGLGGFLQQFFLLFLFGALFGRLMADSGAAASIATMLSRRLGAQRALLIVVLAAAALSYGGVNVFILVFTMYPLGLGLIKQANLPKRLFAGAFVLGAGTFTMTAIPGTPAIQNMIPAQALGTTATAAPLLGCVAAVVMFTLGYWYLSSQSAKSHARGEGFVPGAGDNVATLETDAEGPHWALALIPLLVVIGMVFGTRNLKPPLAWVTAALALGCLAAVVLFFRRLKSLGNTLSQGAANSALPVLNTSSVIGFGAVVSTVPAFDAFAGFLSHQSGPPLVSAAIGVNIMAGLVGSASGGLRIFMETMGQSYLASGVDPAVLHRISAIASGGLDSLPHSGAVITILAVMGLTHREAYKDIFVLTVLVPLAALAVALIIAMAMGG